MKLTDYIDWDNLKNIPFVLSRWSRTKKIKTLNQLFGKANSTITTM